MTCKCSLKILFTTIAISFSFIDALSNKRREQAEKLAEDALKEAKKRQDEEKAAAQAAAEAEAKKQSKSVPATPASTPMAPPAAGPLGLVEGSCFDWSKVLKYLVQPISFLNLEAIGLVNIYGIVKSSL